MWLWKSKEVEPQDWEMSQVWGENGEDRYRNNGRLNKIIMENNLTIRKAERQEVPLLLEFIRGTLAYISKICMYGLSIAGGGMVKRF